MSIGLLRGKVVLEEHQEEWEIVAKETISVLNILLKDIAIGIEHIGSTSIKGIYAKPIIDIVIGVKRFEDILAKNDILEKSGFYFRGQDHPDQYLYICGEDDFITHHIHVTIYDSKTWNDYINMRDYLIAHKEDAERYSSLKMALSEKYKDDRKTYTAKKSEMINEILLKASIWRKENK